MNLWRKIWTCCRTPQQGGTVRLTCSNTPRTWCQLYMQLSLTQMWVHVSSPERFRFGIWRRLRPHGRQNRPVKSLRTSLLDFNEQALVERLIITLDPYVLPRLLQLPSDTNGERKFKEAMADNLLKRHFDLPAYKITSLHPETKQLRFLTEELRKFTIETAFTLSQGQGLLRIKQEPAETQQADSDAEPSLPQLLKAMSALPNLDVPEPDPEPWMISYAWAYNKSLPGPKSDRGSRDMIWSHQQEEPLFISGSRGLPPSPFLLAWLGNIFVFLPRLFQVSEYSVSAGTLSHCHLC